MSSPEAVLERARTELRATQLLLDGGFPAQAMARAWVAACHAASAALGELGELPSSSAAIVAAYGRHATAGDVFDVDLARILRRLYDDRNDVDFALADPPIEHARARAADAQRLVDATVSWLDSLRTTS